MTITDRATKISLFDFKNPPMRAFHMAWIAFFLCFFGWFGIAPLMPVLRDEFHLTKAQIGNSIIASVSITILARVAIGWLCDRIGPRRAHSALLIVGAIPVMGIGLAHDYASFLIFRLAIGMIGASFVITQYHTTVMFAPKVVGSVNGAAAGWGNLGGGVTQMVMPLLFGAFLSMGFAKWESWRLSMIMSGIAMIVTGIAYYLFTQDTPAGDWKDQPKAVRPNANRAFAAALRDYRVWALVFIYGSCFGVELTIDNIASLYFVDQFKLKLAAAGVVAGSFGMMNLFARALGGFASDKVNLRWGLKARVYLLGCTLLCEGVGLVLFSKQHVLVFAILSMMLTGLFVKMSNGATYSVTPYINPAAIGAVAGIVGAGGNLGAVLAGFLFKSSTVGWPEAISILGFIVMGISTFTLLVRFPVSVQEPSVENIEGRQAAKAAAALAGIGLRDTAMEAAE